MFLVGKLSLAVSYLYVSKYLKLDRNFAVCSGRAQAVLKNAHPRLKVKAAAAHAQTLKQNH